eukprot:COSAG01_NODE_49124_length_375_cov_0.561594_1_plen_56_part_01
MWKRETDEEFDWEKLAKKRAATAKVQWTVSSGGEMAKDQLPRPCIEIVGTDGGAEW